MKILVDQNISHRLVNRVSDIFPSMKQVRELGLDNATDRQIWEFSKAEGFSILTFDVDFYDYSVVWGFTPSVITTKFVKDQVLIFLPISSLLFSHVAKAMLLHRALI